MKAIQVLNAKSKVSLEQVPMVKRVGKEVLVKTLFAPIHPRDLFGSVMQFPWTLGIEGSGVIVEANDKNLIGKRCAFYKVNGTFAEYVIPTKYFIVPDELSSEDASLMNINPIAALALQKLTLNQRYIISCANSSLGQILLSLTKLQKPICIVRNHEGRQKLMLQGIDHVIDMTRGSFEDYLRLCIKDYPVYIGFDLVSGRTTSLLLNLIGNGGVLHLVGHISNKTEDKLDYKELIYKNKCLKTFNFTDYEDMVEGFYKEILNEPLLFRSKIAKIVKFEDFSDGFLDYKKNMRDGKVLLKFNYT